MASTTVHPILAQPAAAGAGCGHCAHTPTGPVCTPQPPSVDTPPHLVGTAAELARVMAALQAEIGSAELPAARWVQSLVLGEGEAELILAVGQRCGGLALADRAFHALRAALPDTDIYVRYTG